MPHSRFVGGTDVVVFTMIRRGQLLDDDLSTSMFITNFLFIPIEDLITCNRVFLKSGTGRARMLVLLTVSSGINRRTLPRTSLPTRGGSQLRPFLRREEPQELVQSTWLGRHGGQNQCRYTPPMLTEPVEAACMAYLRGRRRLKVTNNAIVVAIESGCLRGAYT